ncbi:cupin domain-containing protein [Exophiala viscosa]|uniref:Cupin domain-containing protein n=1 Tax=Exophiala viscosa TaxID=2486360 RepID=A0AAN6E2K2_9EURO|nr:cupin domain-containing protein [Exophiala viscosa]
MAEETGLPPNHRYITTHTSNGASVFLDSIPADVPTQPIREDVNFQLMYTTSEFPTDMNGDADVKRYQQFLQGEKPGLTIKRGSVLRVVNFAPDLNGEAAIMHRTVSIDYGIVVAGEIEASLDSGQKRLLSPGDIVIQRGTNHSWRNASTIKWARMVFVLQDALPIQISSTTLGEDYGGIPNVQPSS